MIVLTAIGNDRPGIAARVARVLYETGCNIEDSTMTILCGEFAILLMLSAPPGVTAASLEPRFDAARRELGLHVALRDVGDEVAVASSAPPSCIVTVSGADHPGIVCRVTELLAAAGANITDLNSKVLRGGAPPVYVLLLEVQPPAATDMALLDRELQALAAEIAVEIRVNPVDSASL